MLAQALEAEADFTLVATANSGEAGVTAWRQHRPDVTLMDVRMLGGDGITAIRRIRELDSAARVLMLTSSEHGQDALAAMEAGAAGYVSKTVGYHDLLEAIREVHAGGRPISSAAALRLAAAANDRRLSERELEVLRLLRDGCSHDDICARLTIADRTVRAHVSAIKEKLAAASAAQCVARAYELGIFGG
ncbi:DNA-binding response regulator [bacterium]|nr:DNA-binding response regulator [bacterium]